MAKQEPLKVIIKVVRGNEIIPYENLTEEEKDELGKRLTQRAINAVAKRRGCEVEFFDSPPETVTA